MAVDAILCVGFSVMGYWSYTHYVIANRNFKEYTKDGDDVPTALSYAMISIGCHVATAVLFTLSFWFLCEILVTCSEILT